jgi:predicted dehydrogenase
MYEPKLQEVSSPTRVAVIGCGYWGMNYVRVLSELPDGEVAVVCDQRPARLDEIGRRFPGIALTTDCDEALAADGIDAAVVCTEATSHRRIAGMALEHGMHVLVEKPLTVTVEDADALIAEAEAGERILLTGHTFLYNAGVERIKEIVRNGELGDLYYVYATRTNLGPFRTDVNALWDLAPHDIAIFNHLLDGMPEWVSAVGASVLRNGRQDFGFISLGYPDGVVGHVHVSWADPQKVREFVIVGSDRRIAFNDVDLGERVRVFDRGVKPDLQSEPTSFGEHALQVRQGDVLSPAVPVTEPLKQLCGHFLHCIRRGERPRTPGPDGRAVVAVMQAAERSLERRGAPVGVFSAGLARIPFDIGLGRELAHSAR